jgi:Zn-dependent protease
LDRCRVCGAEEFIPYVCRYCGGTHCVLHRLPENHQCPNIQQARAPRPYLRTERKGPMSTLRPLGVPRLARFSTISSRELYSLLVAWIVLGISFSVRYIFRIGVSPLDLILIFSLTLVLVGTGFLGHELAHKFTAERYGCWAEFKLWTYGALMALLFAIVSQGSLVFAAPGAVYIASRAGYFGERLDRKANGIVSLVGPLVNVAAALVFAAALIGTRLLGFPDLVIPTHDPGGFRFLWSGVLLNLWLAAFNMLPIVILDGQKVFSWDKKIWALVTIPLWVAALSMLSGLIG